MNSRTARKTAAVLISGGGTNLQAFIDAADDPGWPVDVRLVISNRADAYGLERAANAKIATQTIDHRAFGDREAFDAALARALDAVEPDIVILAGFMRILGAEFVRRYAGRLLNIHPSLLPKYPGLDTHQRALDAGDRWHGSTVHFVTEELDGGPPIVQSRVPVLAGDDAKRLAARVLATEHRIYPEAVALLASGRLTWRDGGAWLDGTRLERPIVRSQTSEFPAGVA